MNLTFTGKDCADNRGKIFAKTAYFNATGTTKFNVDKAVTKSDEPWCYSVTLMDERGSTEGPFINRWLSVPKSFWQAEIASQSQRKVCMYTLQGFEKAMENDEGDDTCKGVVKDECIKQYDELDSIHDDCPTVDVKDDCGHTGIVSTSKFLASARKFCTLELF